MCGFREGSCYYGNAAFHKIDNSILHDCLKDWFGLYGTMLTWIDSYQSQTKIKPDDRFAEAFGLPFVIPQGMLLGPLLFTVYTSIINQVILSFKITHHVYAGDAHIYLAIDTKNFDSSVAEFIIIGNKTTSESLTYTKISCTIVSKLCYASRGSRKSGCHFRLRKNF